MLIEHRFSMPRSMMRFFFVDSVLATVPERKPLSTDENVEAVCARTQAAPKQEPCQEFACIFKPADSLHFHAVGSSRVHAFGNFRSRSEYAVVGEDQDPQRLQLDVIRPPMGNTATQLLLADRQHQIANWVRMIAMFGVCGGSVTTALSVRFRVCPV